MGGDSVLSDLMWVDGVVCGIGDGVESCLKMECSEMGNCWYWLELRWPDGFVVVIERWMDGYCVRTCGYREMAVVAFRMDMFFGVFDDSAEMFRMFFRGALRNMRKRIGFGAV